jgi:hypothetical protein
MMSDRRLKEAIDRHQTASPPEYFGPPIAVNWAARTLEHLDAWEENICSECAFDENITQLRKLQINIIWGVYRRLGFRFRGWLRYWARWEDQNEYGGD